MKPVSLNYCFVSINAKLSAIYTHPQAPLFAPLPKKSRGPGSAARQGAGANPAPTSAIASKLLYDNHFQDSHILNGTVVGIGLNALDRVDDIHTLDYLAEDGVTAVEMGRAADSHVDLALLGRQHVGIFECLGMSLLRKGFEQSLHTGRIAVATQGHQLVTPLATQAVENLHLLLPDTTAVHGIELGGGEGVAGDDVELRAARLLLRVRIVTLAGSGHSAALVKVLGIDELRVDAVADIAIAEQLARRSIAGVAVAGLDHELVDHAMEQHAVVIAFANQFLEVGAVARRVAVDQEADIPRRGGHIDRKVAARRRRGLARRNHHNRNEC